ncbi:hypothetical protein LOD99_10708 [Oopsacas minuta]|uniref:DNA-directed RNA polymerase n=1 Tax=Oopsacas minuta TaxID=111878 RepID=A0AAV7KEX0_9METZ|nr:hypothetical protein LOD99_10708 [Oopsacas minuta]
MIRLLVLPHIASFNSMVDMLELMARNLPSLEFNGYPGKRTLFFIDDLRFGFSGDKPNSLSDSTNSGMSPSECKLRGQSYIGWMKLSWCLSEDGIVICQSHKFIDQIPIMVMSKLCMLHKLSGYELMQHGEEENEAGGYFIVNGQEKLIRLLVVQRRNFPIALIRDAWRQKGDIFSNKGISIRCVNSDFSVSIMIAHYLNNGSCSLSISRGGQIFYFPLIYVLKALIDASDFEIFQELMAFTPENDFLEACIISMLRTSLEKGLSTQCDFLNYLGKIYRIKMEVPEWYSDIVVGRLFLSECVCIHLDDSFDKFLLLVELCNKLYALAQGKISPDNLDSPMLQEVLLPGSIFLSVLRSAVINWMKTLRSEFEKQMIRKAKFDREEFLTSIVNFSDISSNISNRISSFIATGNVSRDVLGIPQFKGLTILAERVNYHRYLSHFCSIHRGHFFTEIRTTFVRKLLPEAFGFLCPVNTPDGSPCGLLNHISKSCYITTEFECVDDLKGFLVQKGMKPIQELSRRSYLSLNEDKCIRIILDGCVIGYCSNLDTKHIVLSLRNLKISADSSISHYLEISCSPSQFGSIFPGLYIFSTPGRFMRPLVNIHENSVEFVGSFEQVYN